MNCQEPMYALMPSLQCEQGHLHISANLVASLSLTFLITRSSMMSQKLYVQDITLHTKPATLDALSQVGNDCSMLHIHVIEGFNAHLGIDCTDTEHALVIARRAPTGRVGCRGLKLCACLNMGGTTSWARDNKDSALCLELTQQRGRSSA